METVEKIWMDGQFVDWDKAQIHVLTHSLHYGGAVFEGIRFYEGETGPIAFRLREHLERLMYSASCIDLKVDFTLDELFDAVVELIRMNGITSGYIRPLIYYGYGKMGLNPQKAPVNIAIALWGWGSYLGNEAIKVKISRFIRVHPLSTVVDAKFSGHYLNSILASLEIHKAGFEEALLLDYEGNVAEGPGENIFMVKEGKLITPALGTILPGLTRDAVMTLAKDEGIWVEEARIPAQDLFDADELFFTGTAAEVTPIAQLDEKLIQNGHVGPITSLLQKKYQDLVRGRLPKYHHWLTSVDMRTKA